MLSSSGTRKRSLQCILSSLATLSDMCVTSLHVNGRGVPRRYPARHGPTLDTRQTIHTRSSKAHRGDVAERMSPRDAGSPALTRPHLQKSAAPPP
jgi:hypothetical protein